VPGQRARDSSNPSGRRSFPTGWRFGLLVAVPIAITFFSQFEFVQRSTCTIAGVDCEVLADLIAPAWALALIPIAARLRRLTARADPASGAEDADRTETGRRWAERSATAAQIGAVAIIVLSYTREWERFGERPEAVWLVATIIATLALLAVPVWFIRDDLHARGVRYLDTGRFPALIDRFLFDDSGGRPVRWPHVLAFSAITLVVSFTVLGQLDALLRGMHVAGDPAVGISGLPGIYEIDLSKKTGVVIERVQVWRAYTEAVGDRFGSPYGVVTAHAVFDTLTTIPAYLFGGIALAFVAWRRRLRLRPELRRAFELVILAGLVVLVTTAVLDVFKNVLTWYVMDRAWNGEALLTDANVRLLWLFSLVRTIGLLGLGAACLLLAALADLRIGRLRGALVAVRAEILLVGLFGVAVLMLPQTADVIRGWRVSDTMVVVLGAVVWSMLVRWTSVRNLRLQHRHWEMAEAGDAPRPARVRVPLLGRAAEIGRFAGIALIVLAAVQVALSGLGLQVGKGLVVPALVVAALWLFGLALPSATYVRGDRPVGRQIRRRLPRLLGSAIYLIIGIAVLKAATSSVAYARNEDWWLFFAFGPPLIGIWRILTRTTATMGLVEAVFGAAVTGLVVSLLAAGDPELSPAALAFAGITFTYGSLAFFNSYEPDSLVARTSRRFLSPAWAKPFVGLASAVLLIGVVWFLADPIAVGPAIGTIGMILIAMVPLTLLGAGVVRLSELARPPRLLAAFGIRRTPVVAIVVVWLLLAPAVADQGITDVRRTTGTGSVVGLGFDDVWSRWSANNLGDDPAPGAEAAGERRAVPLLLVSSSGGGLRAAVWTAFVLDCVFEGAETSEGPCAGERDPATPLGRVALMSGVSGGSLGIAAYAAHVVDAVEGPAGSNTWVDEVLGEDSLAAPVGWLFLVDLPRSLIGFGAGISNRSDVMEQAWEASWPDGVPGLSRGVGRLWTEAPGVPAVVFNGTSVNDGCRVNVSTLDAAGRSPEVPACSAAGGSGSPDGGFGATHDLVDFLCPGEDVPLSTAASMSARFPFVSVTGRLASSNASTCLSAPEGAVFVVDGGYLEGSGAGTLLDAWRALESRVEQFNVSSPDTCVVPFMVHIDNGYESPSVTANDAAPREFAVPLLATMSSSSGITAARAKAALAFEQPFTIGGAEIEVVTQAVGGVPVTSRYTRLVTRAHPGVQAPLGWTLSRASIDDLRDQLDIAENAAALAEVRRWLDGDLVCSEG